MGTPTLFPATAPAGRKRVGVPIFSGCPHFSRLEKSGCPHLLRDAGPVGELGELAAAVEGAMAGAGDHFAGAEGAAPGGEGAAVAPGVLRGNAGVGAALGEHVFDPGPARAGGAHLGAAAQLAAEVC